jgi:hypothetical protein
MTLRGVAKRHYAELVGRAPYREPPHRRAEPPGTVWVLACAAALALMVLLPGTTGVGLGSRVLGTRVAQVLETGVLREIGDAALDAVVAASAILLR